MDDHACVHAAGTSTHPSHRLDFQVLCCWSTLSLTIACSQAVSMHHSPGKFVASMCNPACAEWICMPAYVRTAANILRNTRFAVLGSRNASAIGDATLLLVPGRYMHVENATTSSVLFEAAWALARHLVARQQHAGLQKPSGGTSASVDDADAAVARSSLHSSALVAMTHCLSILESDRNQAEAWQPGRRDYMLLANMMLLALQRFSVDPYGSVHWAIMLKSLIGVFLAQSLFFGRAPRFIGTARPAALALLTVAENLLEGPMAPTVKMMTAHGSGPTECAADSILETVIAATLLLGNLWWVV